MSPVIKKKGERFTLPSKYLLFILTIICVALMIVTISVGNSMKPVNSAVGYVIVPFQEGIGKLGAWFSNRSEELVQIRILLDENKRLKEQNAALTEENTILQQDKYELNNLRDLLALDKEYSDYQKIGARIIAKDAGNWYSSFIVDVGTDDGIETDMNVIAGGGLVGRITTVGPNWARVTSIISDNNNVSGMILSSGDNLIVTGDLKELADGNIKFSQLIDKNDIVSEGAKVVTSNISDKYLPNILIGYINYIDKDANNLTKSGLLTPAVDFEHLEEVLIITTKKQNIGDL